MLIYLFGESAVHLTVEGLGSVTVQELGRSVREALNIPESVQDAFAFWLCSPLLGKKISPYSMLINATTLEMICNIDRMRTQTLILMLLPLKMAARYYIIYYFLTECASRLI